LVEEWRSAFEALPRHLFIPDTVWRVDREAGGARTVFDEVAEAYRWWRDTGKPTVRDWLVTVRPDGQRIELSPTR